jgi:hypothetical protein
MQAGASFAENGGDELDGFHIEARVKAGEQGTLYRVSKSGLPFPAVMKVPRIGPGEPNENLISFETESTILPALSGRHFPRFVAAGSLATNPYLVLEWIEGRSLEEVLRGGVLDTAEIARIGAAVADALHELHRQKAIHLDLKPDNVVLKQDGDVALIDFGLAHHALFPDLLAEEKRFAAGSAPYLSPEQVSGNRSDSRSDLFSLGVVLYELLTGELPFGVPRTLAGLRDRLWLDPVPPRTHRKDTPAWLQEIVLRCLEKRATLRYQSAAQLAFDLRHPEQVLLTERAAKTRRAGVGSHAVRWWQARREAAQALLSPMRRPAVPIYMVAVDTTHPDDPRQAVLQQATQRMLSLSPEFRLVCVSVVRAAPVAEPTNEHSHRGHLVRLMEWSALLHLPAERLSLHVIESPRPEGALLEFARRNHVDLIVLGAPSQTQHALAWWLSVASGVTANAPCSVYVVRVPEPEVTGTSPG